VSDSRLLDHIDPLERFMAWETVNSYAGTTTGSTVGEKYRPALGREFPVKVVEVPVADLHVIDSGLGDETARRTMFVDRDGCGFFRFLIHPESEALYGGLIAKYGVAASCQVTPTSSTRTVLVRESRVFAKLTLDRVQDGLGRAVPDWEVRRAIQITRLAAAIPAAELREHGVELIPEIAGAHVGEGLNAGSYIDAIQGVTFRHGMIYRPADFLQHPGRECYPAFSLFSEHNGRPPLIIEWWKEASSRNAASFEKFIDETVVTPVVRALAYLVFVQGLLPDSHLQNMVLAVDPETHRVKTVLFRDMGSVKVNLELRWSRGLPVDALRSPNAASDFKFEWANEMSRRPFYQWFNRYAFSDEFGFGQTLRRYVPGYGPMTMARLVDDQVRLALEEHFPASAAFGARTVKACVEKYLDLHPPKTLRSREAASAPELAAFVADQERLGQTIPLRPGWFDGATPEKTDYGVLYTSTSGPRLALIPE
jgi:hypothetical protein